MACEDPGRPGGELMGRQSRQSMLMCRHGCAAVAQAVNFSGGQCMSEAFVMSLEEILDARERRTVCARRTAPPHRDPPLPRSVSRALLAAPLPGSSQPGFPL